MRAPDAGPPARGAASQRQEPTLFPEDRPPAPQLESPLAMPLGAVPLLAGAEADALLEELLTSVPWERHVFRIFGREHPMPRGIAWYGEHPLGYSGLRHAARAMPTSVRQLAAQLEERTGQPFNGVLLNLYRDGSESMGWHSDDDFEAGPHRGIASTAGGSNSP